MITALIVFLASLVSAYLYRAGGLGPVPVLWWMPQWIRHSWVRDWLCPVVMCVVLGLIYQWTWWLFLCYFLCAAALTTYWDFVPFNHGEDNLYMHGAFIGLACFPLCFVGVQWWAMIVRLCILGIGMGQLNYWANKKHWPYSDWIEELSRGALIVATLPILLITC